MLKSLSNPWENENIYTDLACERYRADTAIQGVSFKKETTPSGKWERIKISSLEGAKSIGRPMGIYSTLHTKRADLLDEEEILGVSREIALELISLFNESKILPKRILVVGLGNPRLTPDSLGPLCAKKIKPTLHIKTMNEEYFSALECSEIAILTPSVPSITGIDSAVITKGVCRQIKPNAVIAIDSLRAEDSERLGTAIQLSNTGIIAGSGLSAHGSSIDESGAGVPVISVGIPTVTRAKAFCHNKSAENRDYKNERANKNILVCLREIGDIIDNSSKIIADGISLAFGLPF